MPASDVAANPLLAALVAEGHATLLARDAAGRFRFHGDFVNTRDVQAALDGAEVRP